MSAMQNRIVARGIATSATLGMLGLGMLTLPAHAILPTLLDVPPEMLVNESVLTKATTPAIKASSPKTSTIKPAPAIQTHGAKSSPKQQAQEPTVAKLPPEPTTSPLSSNTSTSSEPKVEANESNSNLANALTAQHQAINNLLRDSEADALADVGVLWQTAVERSGTIRFAIEKLSRKNAVGVDPNDTDFSKRIIQSLARVGGAASTMVTGTPAGLVGGSIVNDLVQGNPKQSPLSVVTDADMLLLAKEVEALQSQLLTSYYTYRHAKERLALAQQGQQEIKRYQELISTTHSGGTSDPLWGPLANTLTAGLDDALIKTQQEYLSARQNLSLLVGMETLESMENSQNKSVAKTLLNKF